MASPMRKQFVSGHLELGRSRRDSLDVFGQGAPEFSSSTSGPLFADLRGSSRNDVFRSTDFKTSSNFTRAEAPGTGNFRGEVPVSSSEICLDDLIVELEAAEQDAAASSSEWDGVFKTLHSDASGKQNVKRSHERWSRLPSESGTIGEVPEVSPEIMSERAAQWGYAVKLKGSSKESTPRTSSGSAGGRLSSGAIPAVSKDVQDALSSFNLAFLVCDATHYDFPILYASAGFTRMTGYSADESVGKNCRFLQGPDTDFGEVNRLREALKEGRIYTGTLLNYKKDKTPFWNLLTISPIKDDGGKVIKYIGMQAEQTSREQPPRNSKVQKSPVMSSPVSQNFEKSKVVGEASAARRRHSSSSLSRPPVNVLPQKSPLFGDRSNSSDVCLDQNRVVSQRYSLTSSAERTSRSSWVEGSDTDWRETGAAAVGASNSSVQASKISASEEKSSVGKTNRLTSRIRGFFKKDKSSKRGGSGSTGKGAGKDEFEFSDSDDDRDVCAPRAARTSRNSSNNYGVPIWSEGRPLRLEPPISGISDGRPTDRINNMEGHSPTSPEFDAEKRQFCIVHT